MRGWLTDNSSLTARIRARCGRFSLEVVGQGKAGVLPDELAALGVQRHGALWQREVLLVADGEPVVFARSLVAATAIPPPGTCSTAWAATRWRRCCSTIRGCAVRPLRRPGLDARRFRAGTVRPRALGEPALPAGCGRAARPSGATVRRSS